MQPERFPSMIGQLLAEIGEVRECVGAIKQQADVPGLQVIGLLRGELLAQRAAFAATLGASRAAWFMDGRPQRESLVRSLVESRARTALILMDLMLDCLEAPKRSRSEPGFKLVGTM